MIAVCQTEDVLHHVRRRSHRFEEPEGNFIQKRDVSVFAFALVLKVKARLGECNTRWTTDKQVKFARVVFPISRITSFGSTLVMSCGLIWGSAGKNRSRFRLSVATASGSLSIANTVAYPACSTPLFQPQ